MCVSTLCTDVDRSQCFMCLVQNGTQAKLMTATEDWRQENTVHAAMNQDKSCFFNYFNLSI